MNLYKVEQSDNRDYDTYDSFVCAAENEEQARRMHPNGQVKVVDIDDKGNIRAFYDQERFLEIDTWAMNINSVTVELVGTADPKYKKPTVVLASFNAG